MDEPTELAKFAEQCRKGELWPEHHLHQNARLKSARSIIMQLQAENKRLHTIIDNRAEDKIVLEKYKQLQAENKKLRGNLEHISTCLVILKNTKTEEGLKELPSLAATLQEYIDQAPKEK